MKFATGMSVCSLVNSLRIFVNKKSRKKTDDVWRILDENGRRTTWKVYDYEISMTEEA